MIARIDLEYENMIHARTTPTVRVDAYEEDVDYNEKRATIQADCNFPVEIEFTVFIIRYYD